IGRLQPDGPGYEEAVKDLHALLLRAARGEGRRRKVALGQMRDSDHEDLARRIADDARMAVGRKLGEFRGEPLITTSPSKFELLAHDDKIRSHARKRRDMKFLYAS